MHTHCTFVFLGSQVSINFDTMSVLISTSRTEYFFLCYSGILLIAEVVSRFTKIGSFVRKLRKLGFGLENKVQCFV